VEISFEILKENPDPAKFDKGMQTVGVLLEGYFSSNFENRVSQEMVDNLKQVGVEFRPQSVNTRMLVISDGDVAANFVRDVSKKSYDPLGYNRFEKTTYANKELMMNAIEYLIDPTGVIEARTKEVKLRMLDTVRAQAEQTQWRAFNIGIPLLLLGLFGFIFMRLRKRKYSA
jgi:gliding-associated putative ABC transporter substrate-binding component GldG